MIVVFVIMGIMIIAITGRLDVMLSQSKFPYGLADDASLNIPTVEVSILIAANIISVCAIQWCQGFSNHQVINLHNSIYTQRLRIPSIFLENLYSLIAKLRLTIANAGFRLCTFSHLPLYLALRSPSLSS